MKFLKHCGVMIALLLALSFLLAGCDRGGVTDGTSEQTKEEILEESFPEEIVFVSNGDGTCYVDGFVSPDRLQTVELEIPGKSPAGDTVTEIRQLGDAGVLVPHILTPEDYEVMRQKVLAYYGGDEGNFDYQKFILHWGLKGLEFCLSDRLKDDLLATYPITAITNIYVFDPACPSAELASFDQLMAEAYPEYTHARRLRDLEKLIARAESEGLQEHGLSGYLELYQSKKIGAASFKSIILPDTVTKINDRAFAGCINLESIHMPDHLTSIGECAFSECAKLTSIELPDSITSIGGHAFSGCIGLKTVKIPENIPNVAEWAFSNCKNLAKIDFPDGLTRIERYAFSGCASLVNVELPDGITYFGQAAFEKCESLSSIKIPDGITEIIFSVFRECGKLQTVILPETLKSIDSGAFENCHSLTNLTIPDSVTHIESGAFTGCDSLYSRVEYFDYALYYVDRWVVAADIDDMGCLDVIPEDGTRGIGSKVFRGADIFRVVLPDSIRVIGHSAFEKCNNLIEIVIPEGVVSIGEKAFDKCVCLSEVIFPKSVKELYCDAFPKNTRICYIGTQEEWEAIEFSNEYALEDLWVVYNYVPES